METCIRLMGDRIMNHVTIVIPVYKDWPTLSNCIESLKKYLHIDHKVMLVNDMGNEWEELENHILDAISGLKNYEYKRNECNLGFVKTCNRAVLDWDKSENDVLLLNSDTEVTKGFLEEMQRVLYIDDETGVVCPRSNNATFLSVPVHNNGVNVAPEDSYEIYQRIREFLPEREECWTGVGFAFLIKRQVIKEIGLFDNIFGRGYNEENDFCMRARQRGYRIMKANYAYVFHMGGISFQNETAELELKNSSLLLRRYPDYWEKVQEFKEKIDVIDYYADVLTDVIYKKKRVLFVLLDDMDIDYLKKVIRWCKFDNGLDRYDFTIVTNKDNRKRVKGYAGGIDIFNPQNLKGTYHIAYSLSELEPDKKRWLDQYSPVTVVVEDICCINVDGDIKELLYLTDSLVDSLRGKWKESLIKESIDIECRNSIEILLKRIKKFLYIHHIWMFILWHKIRRGADDKIV